MSYSSNPSHPGEEVVFGLVGHPLSHSFSKTYFTRKFDRAQLQHYRYLNFDLESIDQFPRMLEAHPDLRGLNVTTPYKRTIFRYLDEIDAVAEEVGAVNTIHIHKGRLTGFNTDIYGFERSLMEVLPTDFDSGALVLGTGGASLAVQHVLRKLAIPHLTVSRSVQKADLTYAAIDAGICASHHLIIHATPLGMAPETEAAVPFPYGCLGASHILFDLIYNPEKTLFLEYGESRGCTIKNGLKMLILQAEKSWEIWNKDLNT